MKKLFIYILLLSNAVSMIAQTNKYDYTVRFILHGQTRPYNIHISMGDTTLLEWNNSASEKGCYKISEQAIEKGEALCWCQPKPNKEICLKATETFMFISKKALNDLLTHGYFVYNQVTYRLTKDNETAYYQGHALIHVVADIDLTNMWIVNDPVLPIIYGISDNPLGIDWEIIK